MRDLIGERLASYSPSTGYGDAAVLAPMSIGGGEQGKALGDGISDGVKLGIQRKAIERARKEKLDADTLKGVQLKEHYYKMDNHFSKKRDDIYNKIDELSKTPGGISANSRELRRLAGDYNAEAQSSKDFEARFQDFYKATDALDDHYNKGAIKTDGLMSLDDINTPEDARKWTPPTIQPKHIFPEKYAAKLMKDVPVTKRQEIVKNNHGIAGADGLDEVSKEGKFFDKDGNPGLDPEVALQMISNDPNVLNIVEDGAKTKLIKDNQQEYDGYVSQGYSPIEASNKVWYAPDNNGQPRIQNVAGAIAKNYMDKYNASEVKAKPNIYRRPQPTATQTKAGSYKERPFTFTPSNATNVDSRTGHEVGIVGMAIRGKDGKPLNITAAPDKIPDLGEGALMDNSDRVPIAVNNVGYGLKNRETGQLRSTGKKGEKFTAQKIIDYINNTPKEKLKEYDLSPMLSGNITEAAKTEGDTEGAPKFDADGNPIERDPKLLTKKNRSVIIPFSKDNEIYSQITDAYRKSIDSSDAEFNIEDNSPEAKRVKDAWDKRMQEDQLPSITQKAVASFVKQMGRQPTESELQKIKAKYK